jgi:Protein of unknown function (DUF4197)
MRNAILALIGAAVMLCAAPAAAQLERISNRDAVAALKGALEKGSQAAVAQLGRPDGFLGDRRVKIPLPDSLQRGERLARRVGMGRYADELVTAMNRAAEQAVPEARQLFIDSARKMTVQDAKGILTGGDTAGTDFFRRTTQEQLRARFLPIVKKATARVELAEQYHRYSNRLVSAGLMDRQDADLDGYVTQKALDGLYFMVAEEEKKIRRDPVSAGREVIRRVFGAL